MDGIWIGETGQQGIIMYCMYFHGCENNNDDDDKNGWWIINNSCSVSYGLTSVSLLYLYTLLIIAFSILLLPGPSHLPCRFYYGAIFPGLV